MMGHRQVRIVEIVAGRGGVRVSELVAELGVSAVTVRRDLDLLAQARRVVRVYGGALPVRAGGPRARSLMGADARGARCRSEIAAAAAATVSDGQRIGIGTGLVAQEVARGLCRNRDLRVVTTSMAVADLLHRQRPPGLELTLLGGVRGQGDGVVGPLTVAALRDVSVDRLFLTADGFGPQGLTTTDPDLGQVLTAFARSADQVELLVESSRWSARALYRFLPMSDVHGIFTDAGLAAEGRRSLSALGPAVVCVSVDCIDEESVVRAAS